MSKILSIMTAVCIAAASLVLVIPDLTSYDVDGEGAYVKYDVHAVGEPYDVWFAESNLSADFSGTVTITVLERTDDGYDQRWEQRISGNIPSGGGVTDVIDPDVLDTGRYALSGERTSIGGTRAYAWTYSETYRTYTMYSASDSTLELSSVLRMVAEYTSDWDHERHVLDLTGGIIREWSFSSDQSIESVDSDIRFVMDIPKDSEIITMQTVFGKKGVVAINGNHAEIMTGVVVFIDWGNMQIMLVSTNINI